MRYRETKLVLISAKTQSLNFEIRNQYLGLALALVRDLKNNDSSQFPLVISSLLFGLKDRVSLDVQVPTSGWRTQICQTTRQGNKTRFFCKLKIFIWESVTFI